MTVELNASGEAQASILEERLDASAGVAVNFAPSSYDAKSHTADILMVTGERVQRWYGMLEVDTAPGAMDMSRVPAGKVHLFDSHNTDSIQSIVGNVLSVRYDGTTPIATVKFAKTPLGQLAEGMVSRGELTGASVGFQILARQKISREEDSVPVYRAVKTKLMELSLTGIPAQASAGALSADLSSGETLADRPETEKLTMTPEEKAAKEAAEKAQRDALAAAARTASEETLAAERKRVKTIRERVKKVGLSDDFANHLIDDGVAETHLADKIVDELAARGASGGGAIRVGADHTDPAALAERMSDALALRGLDNVSLSAVQRSEAINQKRQDAAHEFMRHGILDMFADLAEARGVRLDRGLRRPQMRARLYDALTEQLALSTSDFPLLLASAANKILLPAYNAASPTFFRIAKQQTFNDFKAHHFLRIGDFPNLLVTGETGEVKLGALSESDQTITALTYGRRVGISRRIIVNDDLSAFSELPAMAGRRSAAVVNTLGFNLFALNSGAGPSITEGGVATNMWDATTHKNFTSSGTAISVAALGVGRSQMQQQTGLDGLKLNLMPSILLTSPDEYTLAQQFTSSAYIPNQSSVVNPFAGALTPMADANLSGTPWYLFADPGSAPAFVYGYVAGYEGPRIATKEGFTTDGVELRVMLDFGCGGIDFRGTYKNAGA